MNRQEILQRLRRMILTLFPELAGTHLPQKARVLRVHGQAGPVELAQGPRRYSVDVEPLRPDGSPDPSRPLLKDVPIDVPWAGPNRGIFALPAVGSLVRIGFYGGSAAYPYIDGLLPDGWSLPAVAEGQYLLQQSEATAFWFDADGNLHAKTADITIESAGTVLIKAATRLDLGDVGGMPVARQGDQVSVDPQTHIGQVDGGSGKVNSI